MLEGHRSAAARWVARDGDLVQPRHFRPKHVLVFLFREGEMGARERGREGGRGREREGERETDIHADESNVGEEK